MDRCRNYWCFLLEECQESENPAMNRHMWKQKFSGKKKKKWDYFFFSFLRSLLNGIAILISDKTSFEMKAMRRDKEGHYITITGSIQEEDITIINIYAPNMRAPQYVRQMLINMKREINSNTIIVGNFNIPLTHMDRSTKQKINQETQTLNDTMDQLDLTDIYRTFHPKTINFTFFSSAHRTFSRIGHILDHKSSLGKFSKIEIIPSIFYDHNAVRLDVNYRRKTIKNSNIWRLNNTLLNKQQITEEIFKKRNQNMHRNEWKWKHNNPKPIGHCKSSAKGKVHSNASLPQETRKESIK